MLSFLKIFSSAIRKKNNFPKNEHFLPLDTHTNVGKK